MIPKIIYRTLLFVTLFQLTNFKISFSQDLSSRDFFIRVAEENKCPLVFIEIEEQLYKYWLYWVLCG